MTNTVEPEKAEYSVGRALVLGPGGIVGTAWTAGLVHGLRHEGVDLGEADLIVGTSAGAIVAAALGAENGLGRLARPVAGDHPRPTAPDAQRTAEVFAVLGTPGLTPEEARRRAGRIAMGTADPRAQQALLTGRRELIGVDAWPTRRLLITAVDAASGEPVVWDRDSGVPLVDAVAASSAFPGTAPPIEVGGRYYMDGALREGTNADLARGARTVLVVAPLAHRFPREPHRRVQDVPGAETVLTIAPKEAALLAFGTDPGDLAVWVPSFRAGFAQAADEQERLFIPWNNRRVSPLGR
ncbi:patatin-like phospholipase family protein [Kitasatospora sp. NPDC085895]|uniref:patatin-like phospholipase family protein n=1 Tax=Kitasatospora sp. NPDC085895 TaxID=3155057 RepID=UPI00344DC662